MKAVEMMAVQSYLLDWRSLQDDFELVGSIPRSYPELTSREDIERVMVRQGLDLRRYDHLLIVLEEVDWTRRMFQTHFDVVASVADPETLAAARVFAEAVGLSTIHALLPLVPDEARRPPFTQLVTYTPLAATNLTWREFRTMYAIGRDEGSSATAAYIDQLRANFAAYEDEAPTIFAIRVIIFFNYTRQVIERYLDDKEFVLIFVNLTQWLQHTLAALFDAAPAAVRSAIGLSPV